MEKVVSRYVATGVSSVEAHRDALLALSKKHHAQNVRVFGSVVRGDDLSHSDVDFLVEFDENAHPLDILALGCDFEKELGVKGRRLHARRAACFCEGRSFC